MANPLLGLLQAVGVVAPQAPDPGADILVTANKQRPMENDPAPPSLGNRSYLEEVADAGNNAPQRKGMFGTRGTLRDVLGTIGDAFLLQSGNQRIYAPRREQEKQSDALVGFTQNPMGAIERLANVNPQLAATLYDNVVQNQARVQAAGTGVQKARDERYQKGAELFGRFYGAANQASYGRVLPILNRIKEQYGLGDEFQIDPEYNEDNARAYQYGGMPTTNQVRDERQREAEQGRNRRAEMNEEGRNARYTPPQPRNPPQRGASQVDAEILDRIRTGTATPAEQQIYRERLTRGGRTRRQPPPLPPGFRARN